jgi:putative redox protein
MDKVRKAIELSLEKYCGVAAMLRKNSPVTYTLERI